MYHRLTRNFAADSLKRRFQSVPSIQNQLFLAPVRPPLSLCLSKVWSSLCILPSACVQSISFATDASLRAARLHQQPRHCRAQFHWPGQCRLPRRPAPPSSVPAQTMITSRVSKCKPDDADPLHKYTVLHNTSCFCLFSAHLLRHFGAETVRAGSASPFRSGRAIMRREAHGRTRADVGYLRYPFRADSLKIAHRPRTGLKRASVASSPDTRRASDSPNPACSTDSFAL